MRVRRRIRLCPVLIGTIGLVLGMEVQAAEYTVSPGESIGAKVKTLRPGDTLLVKPGTYKETITVDGLQGTDKDPIRIKGEKGAVIQGTGRDGFDIRGNAAWLVIEGLRIENAQRAGILINSSQHITIRDCVIGNNGQWAVHTRRSDYMTVENCELFGSKNQHGLYFSSTDFPVARGNRIHDNKQAGIHMNGSKDERPKGMISKGLLENNVIYNNGRDGASAINMDGVEDTVIRNNLLYNNLAAGIIAYHEGGDHTGTGMKYYNNTVYFRPGEGRWAMAINRLAEGGGSTIIKNNIFFGGKHGAFYTKNCDLKGIVSDYNIIFTHPGQNLVGDVSDGILSTLKAWQEASSQDAHTLSVNPAFADPEKADFHLRKDSPAIGAGTSVEGVETDLDGTKRPTGKAFDIGAYESQPM